MGNSQSKLKRKSNKVKVVKRNIQFLLVAPDLEVIRIVIKTAPNAVIGAIFNKALNCYLNAVHIPPHLIPLFRRHNKPFNYLADRKSSIPSKRHKILQKGGAFFYYCSTFGHSALLYRLRIYIADYAQI